MAKRLTEEMVIARTKISDLSKIKRLNCWGSELVDVSLLRKMPSVEVLSLSINKINSLADFQGCRRLEELYIRQNDIRNLNEIMYLQSLPNLKNLWLGENPCANIEGYRLAVLKALPQLQKLDNVQVAQEELREADKYGRTLYHPEDDKDYSEDEEPASNQQYVYQNFAPQQEYSPRQRTPPKQVTTEYEVEESEDLYPTEDVSEESRENSPPYQASSPRRPEPPRKIEAERRNYSPEADYADRRRNSYEKESSRQICDKPPSQTSNNFLEDMQLCDSTTFRDSKIVNSQSVSCIKEYANGERYVSAGHGGSELSVSSCGHDKRERFNCLASAHRTPFQRRPVTRNSNILSAVLCLVKELDYPSLEVVEMAVRCRMDELDE